MTNKEFAKRYINKKAMWYPPHEEYPATIAGYNNEYDMVLVQVDTNYGLADYKHLVIINNDPLPLPG